MSKNVIQSMQGKLVLVCGLGKSGQAAIEYLHSKGAQVIGAEKLSQEVFADRNGAFLRSTQNKDIKIYFEDTIPELNEVSLAVLSPGIPPSSPVVEALKRENIQCIGEFELGLLNTEKPLLIVTGSNGKSTTTALIGELLAASDKAPLVCGNIGTPIVTAINARIPYDVVVVEASSYQLDATSEVNPHVGIVLNISENHLERHGTLENYTHAKLKVFQNQSKKDFSVLNGDDVVLCNYIKDTSGTLCLFGQEIDVLRHSRNYAHIKYDPKNDVDSIELKIEDLTEMYELASTKLIGLHNRYNWAAALLGARLLGASQEGIEKVIPTFAGLAHRLEVVCNKEQIIINDTKSTTVASTVAALDSISRAFPKRPIYLLLGGKVKKASWLPLAEKIRSLEHNITPIFFGGDGEFVKGELGIVAQLGAYYPTLTPAVHAALKNLPSNGILLFSPAGTSFDEFSGFEERGDYFKEIISKKDSIL